jgi:hypothetical protein
MTSAHNRRSNLLKYSYSPDHGTLLWFASLILSSLAVYTFDFFQHVFNLATMKIDVGVTTIDVLQIIGKAPVQIMSVHWDPVANPKGIEESIQARKKLGYLYNVEVWHERAFPKRGGAQEDDQQEDSKD